MRVSDSSCYPLLKWALSLTHTGAFTVSIFGLFIEFAAPDLDKLSQSQWFDLLYSYLRNYRRDRHWRNSEDSLILPQILFQRCKQPLEKPLLAFAIAAKCEPAFIKLLLDGGANIHEYSDGITPLQAAALTQNLELFTQLIQLGADVNAPARGDSNGGTVLQFICSWDTASAEDRIQQKSLIQLVISKNADVNAPAHGLYGATALQLICVDSQGNPEMQAHKHELIKLFIKLGADVNAEPGPGSRTPLQKCAAQGDLATAALLVQYGADPHHHPVCRSFYGIKGEERRSSCALDTAVDNGRLDMTKYLLNVGALSGDPGDTGYDGALKIAKINKYRSIGDVIREHIATVERRHGANPLLLSMHQACMQKIVATREARYAEHKEFEEQEQEEWNKRNEWDE